MKFSTFVMFAAQLANFTLANHAEEDEDLMFKDSLGAPHPNLGHPPKPSDSDAYFTYNPSDITTLNTTSFYEVFSGKHNYDYNYLRRICAPLIATQKDIGDASDIKYSEASDENGTAYLKLARQMFSTSPYPCERILWFEVECAPAANRDRQKKLECYCRSPDYWELQFACLSCYAFHVGNETEAKEDREKYNSQSSAMCTPTISPMTLNGPGTRSSRSANPTTEWLPTIVTDHAPGMTDVSLYWSASKDHVPASINNPEFVRTVDGTTTTMVPGVYGTDVSQPWTSVPSASRTLAPRYVATILNPAEQSVVRGKGRERQGAATTSGDAPEATGRGPGINLAAPITLVLVIVGFVMFLYLGSFLP